LNKPRRLAAAILLPITCTACFYQVPESIIEGRSAETTADPTKDFHACVAAALASTGEVFIDESGEKSGPRSVAIKTSRDPLSGDAWEGDDGHVHIFIGSIRAGRRLSWSDDRFCARKAKAIAIAMHGQCGTP
jgi:hypothetical protein